jgi:hypothetical protein
MGSNPLPSYSISGSFLGNSEQRKREGDGVQSPGPAHGHAQACNFNQLRNLNI